MRVAPGASLSGFNFESPDIPAVSQPRAGFVSGLGIGLTGRVVTEDGSPLPAAPLMIRAGNSNGATINTVLQPGGGVTLRMFNLPSGDYQISIGGLPPGYFLKSISQGATNWKLGPIKLPAPSSQEVLFTLGVVPPSSISGVKVSGTVTDIAPEWTLHATTVQLAPDSTSGPTITTPLAADNSFEFSRVPPGSYRVSVPGWGGSPWSTLNVGIDDVSGVPIDAHNNPFPEYPGGSFSSVFDSGTVVNLRGVITQGMTQTHPGAPVHYFRMDVTDETTGTVTPWAIMITSKSSPAALTDALGLRVGSVATVTGTGSRDGTHRLTVIDHPNMQGSINGLKVLGASLP